MAWRFTPTIPEHVETEVTQRDNFNNDDVDLSETIVRESIQNSLDAASSNESTVHIRIRLLSKEDGLISSEVKKLVEGQLEHAEAAGVNIDEIDFDSPTALIIEDFGTDGLTGQTNIKDDDNFSDFWRRHGKSHKSGSKRGRWGLGKLVYSTSSQASVFFGLTRRASDNKDLLMGQTVLNSRVVDGNTYPSHAFFADYSNGNPSTRLPVPIKDSSFVDSFKENFQLKRTSESGLSIVIPYPDPSFEIKKIAGVAIANYFYPLITGKLVIEIDNITIDQFNVRELAGQYSSDMFPQIDLLFEFIGETFTANEDSLLQLNKGWQKSGSIELDHFDSDSLGKAKTAFKAGKIVGVKFPAVVTKKDGSSQDTSFRVFVKRPEELNKGLDIYVRGGLTLPGEAKFRERKALGAMIADDDEICALLGDAENAAHTQWTQKTEKLTKNYKAPGKLVGSIKKSVLSIYKLLAEITEERDEDALASFFWYKNEQPKKRKKKKTLPPTIPKLPKRHARFNLTKTSEGFTLSCGEGLKEDQLPYRQKVKVAYDVLKGEPFQKYSNYDFSVGNNGTIQTTLSGGVKILRAAENILDIMIESLDFSIVSVGFDTNRDLIVRLPEGIRNAEEA